MRFAMYVPNFDTFGQVSTLVELAKDAERAGWDGFFLWDHLLPDADSWLGPVVDPWGALTAIAGATQRWRRWTCVAAQASGRGDERAVRVCLLLEFTQYELIAMMGTAFIAAHIAQDGESNWLEGAMLLALYLLVVLAFFFLPGVAGGVH
jgi:hypothetical protein